MLNYDKALTPSINRSVDKVKKVNFKVVVQPKRRQTSSETKQNWKDKVDPCKLILGMQKMTEFLMAAFRLNVHPNWFKFCVNRINKVCKT